MTMYIYYYWNSEKINSHTVHFLLGSPESLKQTQVMNEVICNVNSVSCT